MCNVHADAPLGASLETGLGVVVERRSFLGICAVALSGSTAALPRLEDEPRLSLEEFLAEVLPIARRLRAQLVEPLARSAEDRYLHTLASFAVRLGEVPVPELRPTPQGEEVAIGASWAGDPFVVLHWRMAPGSRIHVHPHLYGDVCTLGLEGQARVRNYETVGEPDFTPDRPAEVLRTNDQLLRPGDVNLVPLTHGFCHGFEAGPEGARGLDITTRLRERTRTPLLELEPEALDAARGAFRGRWRFAE